MDEEKTLLLIGEKLKNLRINAGYTSYENFAIRNEVPRQLVYRAEKGENITLRTLIRLLNIHQIGFDDFFKEVGKEQG